MCIDLNGKKVDRMRHTDYKVLIDARSQRQTETKIMFWSSLLLNFCCLQQQKEIKTVCGLYCVYRGRGGGGGGVHQQSRLINILSQHIVHGDERHIHYIEQIIYENTHIQLLMFNKKLMKRNKAKTINDFMRK